MSRSPGDGVDDEKNGCSENITQNSTTSGSREHQLNERMLFHDNLKRHSRCDLETPASLIANVNIKQLLTPAAFDCLPTAYQNELIKLLPETDRIALINNDATPFALTVNALSNEFFAKSCVEYRDRLRNGEFCIPPTTANSRTDVDPVVWECDFQVLSKEFHSRPDIPKAGEPFICKTKQKSLLNRSSKKMVKKVTLNGAEKRKHHSINKNVVANGASNKSLLKSSKSLQSSSKPTSASVVAQKAVSKAKAVSNQKTREKEAVHTPVAGVKRPRSVLHSSEKDKTSARGISAGSGDAKHRDQVVITKFKKVVENSATGAKVTKVVPIVVRNPHGQVVTTLANCNPLLTQMIKNPVNSQTLTTAGNNKLQSLLPKIIRRDNHVIVTLRGKPGVKSNNGLNKAVTEVISKVRTSCSQQAVLSTSNGGSRPTPVIVTVHGSNGSLTNKLISTAVNMERSKQICDSSKQSPPTLNLERSYQICKQVLGKADGSPIMVVGPGGKKKIVSKPVRNRHVDAAGSIQNTSNSSDIPLYRNKHRGKPTLTLSGHVFLAMKTDKDGYAIKAYKRKTAFKQKPKKKVSKVASKKAPTPVSTTSKTTEDSISTSTDNAANVSGDITLVTPSLYATQPVLSVTESKSDFVGDVCSLLDSCMCNKRALIICRKCGAFCHAECTSKEHCLACLGSER